MLGHGLTTARLAKITPRMCSVRAFPLGRSPPKSTEPIRALLRRAAQQVAVVTCKLPGSDQFHGATISSFSSVAMEPMPMVTFAMRTPSRVVESIEEIGSQFNINLLAAHQASVAEKFARPDLHPDPWSEELKFDLDERGIPVFPGSLGWLKCHTEGVMAMGEENGSSLLLLGQVDGVQHGEHDALPLVYHRRAYTSVQSVHIPGSPYNSS